ncbi:hypothetical protein KIPB_014064, partial [Kipferlia bialata]
FCAHPSENTTAFLRLLTLDPGFVTVLPASVSPGDLSDTVIWLTKQRDCKFGKSGCISTDNRERPPHAEHIL